MQKEHTHRTTEYTERKRKAEKGSKKDDFSWIFFCVPVRFSFLCVCFTFSVRENLAEVCVCASEPLELSALFTNTSASAYCHTACVVVVGGVSSVSGGCATVCVRSSNRERKE